MNEKNAAYCRAYYEKYKGSIKAYQRSYYAEHREECIERVKRNYREHREARRDYERRYRAAHKAEFAKKAENRHKRLACDASACLRAENLYSRRKSCGMTQIEFAKLLGVSASSISLWEANKNPIPDYVFERLNVETRSAKEEIRNG